MQHATSAKLVESLSLANVDDVPFLEWNLLAALVDGLLELLLVVGLVEVHEVLEVVEFSQTVDVENLVLVVLNYLLGFVISHLLDSSEEVLAQLFLDHELAIFDVQLEDAPGEVWCQLRKKLILAHFCDIWDVTELLSEKAQAFGDFELYVLNLRGKGLVLSLLESIDDDLEYPLSLFLKLLVSWIEPILDFDLQSFRNVLFDYLEVLSSAKNLVDFLCDKLVLELHGNLLLLSFIVRSSRLVSFLDCALSLRLNFDLDLLLIIRVDLVLFKPSLFALVFLNDFKVIFIKLLLLLNIPASVLLLLPLLSPLLLLINLIVIGNEVIVLAVDLVIVVLVILKVD